MDKKIVLLIILLLVGGRTFTVLKEVQITNMKDEKFS